VQALKATHGWLQEKLENEGKDQRQYAAASEARTKRPPRKTTFGSEVSGISSGTSDGGPTSVAPSLGSWFNACIVFSFEVRRSGQLGRTWLLRATFLAK
jgi:hypothetical protein